MDRNAELLARFKYLRPVPLANIHAHRAELQIQGVYFLIEGAIVGPHDPLSAQVVYIGRGINQTVFQRGRLHLATITDARTSSGKPATGNSVAFKAYREIIGRDPSNLWFVAGAFDGEDVHFISAAEEHLIRQYEVLHGRKPVCNTAGGRALKQQPNVAASGKPKVGPTSDFEKKRQSTLLERDLLASCKAYAEKHGLAAKPVLLNGKEEVRIGLPLLGSGRLRSVAARLRVMTQGGFRLRAHSLLPTTGAAKFGRAKASSDAVMVSTVCFPDWPVTEALLETFLDAAIAEVGRRRTSESR